MEPLRMVYIPVPRRERRGSKSVHSRRDGYVYKGASRLLMLRFTSMGNPDLTSSPSAFSTSQASVYLFLFQTP
jgi:hypothetical protein